MVLKKKILKTFLDLVKIDSPSGQESNISKYIKGKLAKEGYECKEDAYGNLISHISGKGNPFILSAHLDTVAPCHGVCAVIKGDIIKSKGNTILGSDDKAGIAEILETIKYLKKAKIKHRPLELIFTKEEEVGLNGALHLNFNNFKAKEGLNLDKGGRAGLICLASPYRYLINIEVKGKSAHAGVDPEKGISAIKVAAEAITKVRLGKIDQETSINIGIFQGGENANSIAEYAIIKAEARSHEQAKALKQVDILKEAFITTAKKYKARIKFEFTEKYAGYKYDKQDSFIQKIKNTIIEQGRRPKFIKSGGGNDANIFAMHGIKVVAISYGGQEQHTTREWININEMIWMVKFLVEFLTVQ